MAAVNRGDWVTPQGSSWDDNTEAKMNNNSVSNPKRNEGISMSKGKAGASSETHQSEKQSIADLIQAIKTDPEVKRLLDDALAEDKSSAADVNPERPATVPSNSAQQVLTTGTNARDESSSCETGCIERATCVVGNCTMSARAANAPVGQGGCDGDWPHEGESVATSKTWTDNRRGAPVFDAWTSRFSCPTKLVVVQEVKYTIHDPIFNIMFPARSASTNLVQLGDDSFMVPEIETRFFANILEFTYTQDRKYLHHLSPKDLNQALAFADKYGSTALSSALIPILQLDFSDAYFCLRAADIYRSDWEPYPLIQEFREYFRETLKVELQSRLENDTSEQFLSRIHSQFTDAGLALLDVALVLNSLWSTAELKVERADPGEHWSDGGNGWEDDQADENGDEEVYSSSGDSWGAAEHKGPVSDSQIETQYQWFPVGNGWIESDSYPQPAREAAQGNLWNDNIPAPSVIMPPEDVLPGLPHQQRKPTSLQSASALARCVYHWLEHNRDLGSATNVAEGLGCTEHEADLALQELALAGVISCLLGFPGHKAYCVEAEWQPAPASPDFAPSNLPETPKHDLEAERVALEAPSDEARRAYDWLRQAEAKSPWSARTWFRAEQVAEGIGRTITEALRALDELQALGRVSVVMGGSGFAEYCACIPAHKTASGFVEHPALGPLADF
ncbi:hypothetical protein PV04_04283 [Phialophora macrospora]|uniref:BTB domain-containing protein n=1 Tax=Phialophora macrospora TaxID=1851006 RepID=A0A0D2FP16_9EURO|nr:hypothetical protein PV04_04283 [Phialophora macrospora]